jgi:hypothetical protein
MKRKKKFDPKAFLIQHGEKVALGLFVVVFFALLYLTLGLTPYAREPDQMVNEAGRLQTLVSGATTDQYLNARTETDPGFVPVPTPVIADKADEPVRPYPFVSPSLPINPPQRIRHQPKIFALEDLHATSGRCTIAVLPPEEQGLPSERGPNGGAAEPDQPTGTLTLGGGRQPRPPRQPSPAELARAGGEGGYEGGYAEERRRAGVGFLEGRFGGPEGEGEGGRPAGEIGAPQLDPGVKTEGRTFVCLTGKLPMEKQQSEFYHELAVTLENFRNPENQVQYASFEVQRVEVNSFDQQLTEEDWKDSTLDLGQVRIELGKWAFVYPDLVPQILLSDVCSPLPPRIDRADEQWLPKEVVHPYFIDEKLILDRVGVLRQAEAELEAIEKEAKEGKARAAEVLNPYGEITGPRTRRGGEYAPPVGGYEGEFGESSRTRPGTRGRPGAEGGPVDADLQLARRVPYRLFRFFDFSVQPGKTYVYRVRMIVRNPNHGLVATENRFASPDITEKEYLQGTWSEQSPSRNITDNKILLVGGVKSGTATRDPQAQLILGEWVSKYGSMAYQLFGVEHRDIGLDRPMMTTPSGRQRPTDRNEYDVLNPKLALIRGAVLNLPPLKTLIAPPRSTVPQKDEVLFRANSMLLDMTGGSKLRGQSRVEEYGHVVFMQPDGSLVEHSQLQDFADYNEALDEIKRIANMNKVVATPLWGPEGEGGPVGPIGGPEGGRFDPLRGMVE